MDEVGWCSVCGCGPSVRLAVGTQVVHGGGRRFVVDLGERRRRRNPYLNDFLILGQTGTDECERDLALSLELCKFLGVTVATQKTEGPATSLSFLGIVLNTDKMVIQLPQDKFTLLRNLIREWKGRKTNKTQAACRPKMLLLHVISILY